MHRDFDYIQKNQPEQRTLEILYADPGFRLWASETDGGWSIHSALIDGARAQGRPWWHWIDSFHYFLVQMLRSDEDFATASRSLQSLIEYAPKHESVRGLLAGGLWLLGQADTPSTALAYEAWSEADDHIFEAHRSVGALADAARVSQRMSAASACVRLTSEPGRIYFMQASNPCGRHVERITQDAGHHFDHERLMLDDFDAGFVTGASVGANLALEYETPMAEMGGLWSLSWAQNQTFEKLATRKWSRDRRTATLEQEGV